jgi:hypothetical protein
MKKIMSGFTPYPEKQIISLFKEKAQEGFRDWRNILSVAILLIASQNILHLLFSAADPLQLDYSEGLVLSGLDRIMRNPFLEMAYSFNPVYYYTTDLAYPPVFPYSAAALSLFLAAISGLDIVTATLYGARIITLFGLGLSAWFIYRLVRLYNPNRLVSAAAAGLFFCFHPTIYWGANARVDALGLAFALGGLYVACRLQSAGRISGLYLIGLPLLWLAFFTKQSFVAVAGAIGIYLFISGNRRNAIVFTGFLVLLVIFGLIGLTLATDGNYLFFLTMERYTPFSIPKLGKIWLLFLVLYGPMVVLAFRHAWFNKNGLKNARLLALWGGLTGLLTLTVGKVGAADYYFFEFIAFICVMAGYGLAAPSKLYSITFRAVAVIQVLLLLVMSVWLVYPDNHRDTIRPAYNEAADYITRYSTTEAKIFVELSGPAISAKRPDLIFDHFIFRQLATAGKRDGEALVQDFADKRYNLALFGYDILSNKMQRDSTEFSSWPAGFEMTVRQNYVLLRELKGTDGRIYIWALIPKQTA